MPNRRINHSRRILNTQNISKTELAPGMMISFRYNKPGTRDKNPLALFIHKDLRKQNVLLHCLNINYLYEQDVQKLFFRMAKIVDIKMEYGSKEKGYSRVLLTANPAVKRGVDGQKLYERLLKPAILNQDRTKNCYKTYNIKKISNLKLVNYKFDVFEKQIREETQLSKHALKTSELYKNIEEQQIDIRTGNVKTKSQDEIRKDMQE